jgi:DegV family protein with EDD domain
MRNSIGIMTEETTGLSEEIIKENRIEIVPCKVSWPEGDNLPGENIYQKMREGEKMGIKTFPKTSQPSPKDYLSAFQKQLQNFEKILCITLSSKLSGSFNSAYQARKMLKEKERIFLFDSLNATVGQALLVLKAIDLIKEGKEIEEILKECKKSIPKIHFYIFLEDPKWLEAGGRLSHSIANWVRKFQKMHLFPCLGIKNGVVKAIGITKGKDICEALLRQIKSKSKKLGHPLFGYPKKIRVAIGYTDNFEMAKNLEKEIKEKLKAEIPLITFLSPVVGAHVGPGSLAAAWTEI